MVSTISNASTKQLINLLLTASFIILSGCNGSSSTASGDDINNNLQHISFVDPTNAIAQSTELALFYPENAISQIQWKQTSGDPLTLLTPHSKVIAFTPKSSGDYTFEVSFSIDNGAIQTLTQTVSVTEQTHKISVRLAHTVLSENKVSLRVFTDPTIDTATIQWQQNSGPQVDFDQANAAAEPAIFFNAPKVSKDTLLTFTVTASDGNDSYSDKVMVLVEPAENIASNAYFDQRVAKVFPYKDDSPYADNIVNCVYSNTLSSSCTLGDLPLLGSQTNSPSVDDIMDRLVVSHQWMGDRFKDFLINEDPNNDFKRLLRATTAVVISYDVRPSFYWAATGAIYLDAENFWLTAEERDTLNEAPDYRSDFGKDLQFVMPWRYVKDNDYASPSFPKDQRVTRTENDGFYRLASLLYHELAHANDFFPSTEWFNHSSQSRVLDAALSSNFESDQLAIAIPLENQTMRNLAQVSFAGTTATSTQKAYLPSDIAQFFPPDNASDFYAYSSEREDYAMLFEEFMMQSRFNVYRDVAITNHPSGDNISRSDYIVTWGQRGRIGETAIKPRVAFSASRVLPEFDTSTALANVLPPIPMIAGDDWLENISISPINANKRARAIPKTVSDSFSSQPVTNYRYYHKKLPQH